MMWMGLRVAFLKSYTKKNSRAIFGFSKPITPAHSHQKLTSAKE
jgi:hypothetical protein